MPRTRLLPKRGLGAVGIALTAWDIWRRLPKQHRRLIIQETRRHAPNLARSVARQVQQARESRAARKR